MCSDDHHASGHLIAVADVPDLQADPVAASGLTVDSRIEKSLPARIRARGRLQVLAAGGLREVWPSCGGAAGGYGCSVRHGKTGICTARARFGASLAVIHAVLAALSRAALARDRAERADGLHVCTAPGDGSSGKPADVGALQIQRHAQRHGFRMGLLDAR